MALHGVECGGLKMKNSRSHEIVFILELPRKVTSQPVANISKPS